MGKRDASPKRARKVDYVVFQGEDYEGGSVEGVYDNIEAAEEHVKDFISAREIGKRKFKPYGDLCWRCGCDYVEIQEWPVETKYEKIKSTISV